MSYRWLLLVTLVAALAAASYGIWVAAWIDVPEFATIKLVRSPVEQGPVVCWVLAVIGMLYVGFGMIRGAIPGTSALLTAIVSLGGAATMFLVTRNINEAQAIDRFSNPTPVTVATGAWLTIAGFVVAALAALSLWRAASSSTTASTKA